MKMKYRQLVSLFWVLCLFGVLTLPAGADERPVVVKFENTSDHIVRVHILSNDAVIITHILGPQNAMETEVEPGNRIRLEYDPPPHRTTLSEMGSRNELNRTVLLTNDGANLFIQERFSGQREKGKGTPRIKFPTASDPDEARGTLNAGQTGQGNKKNPDEIKNTRKEDPLGPEPKKQKDMGKAKKTEKDKKDG